MPNAQKIGLFNATTDPVGRWIKGDPPFNQKNQNAVLRLYDEPIEGAIDPKDQSTWPVKGHYLSSAHVQRILECKDFSPQDMHDHWPFVFTASKGLRTQFAPQGQPALMVNKQTGATHYAVANGNIQLFGDEIDAELAVRRVKRLTNSAYKATRDITLGDITTAAAERDYRALTAEEIQRRKTVGEKIPKGASTATQHSERSSGTSSKKPTSNRSGSGSRSTRNSNKKPMNVVPNSEVAPKQWPSFFELHNADPTQWNQPASDNRRSSRLQGGGEDLTNEQLPRKKGKQSKTSEEAKVNSLQQRILTMEAEMIANQQESKSKEDTTKGKVLLMADALKAGHQSVAVALHHMQKLLSDKEKAQIDSPDLREAYEKLFQACPQMGERVIRHDDTTLFEEWEAEGYALHEEGDRALTANGELVNQDEDLNDDNGANEGDGDDEDD